jgi:hypothetical protein
LPANYPSAARVSPRNTALAEIEDAISFRALTALPLARSPRERSFSVSSSVETPCAARAIKFTLTRLSLNELIAEADLRVYVGERGVLANTLGNRK